MRILQAFEPATGGVPVHVESLTACLVERGHEVDVALSRQGGLAPRFSSLAGRVVETEMVPDLFAARANARALAQLVRALRSGRYDLVHVHGAKAGTLGRSAALLTRTPSVYSSHAWVYRTQDKRPRRGQAARRALTLGVERMLGPRTGAIICVSEDERQAAIDDRIAGPDRLRVGYYGVSFNGRIAADDRLTAFREEGPLFGFMARLDHQKALPVLLGALEILRNRGTLPRFAIVGSGSMQGWVQEQLASGGFGSRVLFQPFDPPVEPKLAAFDAFVLTSYWEALPIGILEAMGAGLPVIANAVNGIPEAVEHEVTGILVPPEDPDAMADAVQLLAADGELRDSMGAAGRRRCEERFTLGAMTDRVEAVYREVVSEG